MRSQRVVGNARVLVQVRLRKAAGTGGVVHTHRPVLWVPCTLWCTPGNAKAPDHFAFPLVRGLSLWGE